MFPLRSIYSNDLFVLQAMSLVLVAYATFAHSDAALVQAVTTHALHMPGMFDPQAIANTLWGLALLDSLSPAVWNCLLMTFLQAHAFNSKSAPFSAFKSLLVMPMQCCLYMAVPCLSMRTMHQYQCQD